jgi:hypothetical protein
LTRLRAALARTGQQRESAPGELEFEMEIWLKVDKEFVEMCKNSRTRPEVVLLSFMWDVIIAGEGPRPERPEMELAVFEQLREYAWGYFLRLNFPERYKKQQKSE